MGGDNACCKPCPGVWWVTSDPCGLFSANFTIVLLLYAWTVMLKVIIVPWFGWGVHAGAFSFIIVAALASHTRCQYTDPGCIPHRFSATVSPASLPHVSEETVSEEDFRKLRVCRRCETVKPPGSHHCSSCGRCVMRMDHHCPWVNNCVAVFNQKYFINFLFWTCSSCIYAGILLVMRFVQCSGLRRRRFEVSANSARCDIGDAGVALAIITFIEALIFGLFTGIMMFDQISAILEGTTGIDALQGNKGERKPKMEALRDVFGEAFSWRWFLPFTIKREVFDKFESDLRLAESTRRYAVKKLREKERRQAEEMARRDAEVQLRERNAVSHVQDSVNGHGGEATHDAPASPTTTASSNGHTGYKDLNS